MPCRRIKLSILLLLVASFLHADEVDRVVQGIMQQYKMPGTAIAVIRDGKLVRSQGYGLANVELNVAVRPETIFQSGSVGKQFTATAVMMLVEEGKLDIAAPVFQYLPEFKDLQVGVEKRNASTGNTELVLEPQLRPMMVQDLLRHTSGLIYGGRGNTLVHKMHPAREQRGRDEL